MCCEQRGILVPEHPRKSVSKQTFQGFFLALTKSFSYSFALDNLVKIVTVFSGAKYRIVLGFSKLWECQ